MAPDVTQLPLWGDGSPTGAVGALDSDLNDAVERTWDVVVVGAGITGLLAAERLLNSGRTVCLVDADRVGRGVSSQATVKGDGTRDERHDKPRCGCSQVVAT